MKLIMFIWFPFVWMNLLYAEDSLIVEKPCTFFEGISLTDAVEESLRSGACNNCDCIKNSFIQTDISSLDQDVLAMTGGVTAEIFKQEVMPNFIQEIKEFGDLSPSCGLAKLEEMNCQGDESFQGFVKAMYSQYYNRSDLPNIGLKGNIAQDDLSCFPTETIKRNEKQTDVDKLRIRDDGVSNTSLNVVVKFRKKERLNDEVDDYGKLVEDLRGQEKFKDFVKAECDQFFENIDKFFCQKPNQMLSHENNKKYLKFDLTRKDLFENASYRELELFTISCHEEKCKVEKELPFCQKRNSKSGYDPNEFYDEFSMLNILGQYKKELEAISSKVNDFCPMLECESYDEALDKVFDGVECKKKTPPRTMAELKSYCDKLNAEDPETICAEDPLAGLLKAYRPSDEPFKVDLKLLGGKKPKEMKPEELKEVLLKQGVTEKEIQTMGEWGVLAAFDLEIPFAPSKNQEVLTPAQIAGQKQAESLILSNAEAAKASASSDAKREKPSFSERQLKARARTEEAIAAVATKPKSQILPSQQFVEGEQAQPYYSSTIADFSEKNSIDKNSKTQKTEERKRADIISEMSSIEDEIKRMAAQARESTSVAEKEKSDNSLDRLTSQLNSLRGELARANQKPIGTGSSAARREVDSVNDFRNSNTAVLPSSNPNNGLASISDDTSGAVNSGRAARSPASTGGGQSDPALIAATLAARNPASNAGAYFESRTQDLPTLTLEDLSQVKIGEEFVLGIRDGGDLSRVKLVPETVNGEVRYSLVLLDPLSDNAKASLAQSPFVKRFVLEDSVQSVIGVKRRSIQHQGLKEILPQN